MSKNVSNRARIAVTAVAMAGAGIAVSAVPASAAVSNTFKICAKGNYAAYGVIPQQGYAATFLAYPGTCRSIGLGGGTTYAKVYGVYNTHPDVSFYVGTAHFSASTGWTGGAEGTTTSPYLVNFG
ncbi:hypothetical protein [Actinoallomurus sp. NPDC050550]|uniref:hypothetical protein n=1 Tax=Actinoallomurus sp. NPDC050550 TaxID=3154937 RepID=UPI0033F59A24